MLTTKTYTDRQDIRQMEGRCIDTYRCGVENQLNATYPAAPNPNPTLPPPLLGCSGMVVKVRLGGERLKETVDCSGITGPPTFDL